MKHSLLISILAVVAATTSFASGPSISVSVAPDQITNEGEEAVFTFTLSSPSSRTLFFNLALGGTAVPGRDYSLIGNFNKNDQLVIMPGQTIGTLTLHTFVDEPEGRAQESAIVFLLHGKRYSVGSPDHAKVAIENLR